MNAVLAKPIPPIWFIQAGAIDLSLAAALRTALPFGCATIRRGLAKRQLLRRTIISFAPLRSVRTEPKMQDRHYAATTYR
jgi:hypothetical protein